MQVEVIRSTRRSRTVALRPTAEGVRISIPARSTKEEEAHYVKTLMRQYERSQKKGDTSLIDRARLLADRYKLQKPSSIEWAANQKSRWGSCNTGTGVIRISTDVQPFPQWVRDYVIMHELAHLTYGGHGPRFWALVERYPKTERARGFLIAKGLEELEDRRSDDLEPAEPEPVIDLRDSVADLDDETLGNETLGVETLGVETHEPKKTSFFSQMNIFAPKDNQT